jgi:hypothetical protein
VILIVFFILSIGAGSLMLQSSFVNPENVSDQAPAQESFNLPNPSEADNVEQGSREQHTHQGKTITYVCPYVLFIFSARKDNSKYR